MKSLVCQYVCFIVHLSRHVPELYLPTTVVTVLHVIRLLVQLFQSLEVRNLPYIGTYAVILNPCLCPLTRCLDQKARICCNLDLSKCEVLVHDGAMASRALLKA